MFHVRTAMQFVKTSCSKSGINNRERYFSISKTLRRRIFLSLSTCNKIYVNIYHSKVRRA
jgi:hypothetical protein